MVNHLLLDSKAKYPGGLACKTRAWSAASSEIRFVTCKRCLKNATPVIRLPRYSRNGKTIVGTLMGFVEGGLRIDVNGDVSLFKAGLSEVQYWDGYHGQWRKQGA